MVSRPSMRLATTTTMTDKKGAADPVAGRLWLRLPWIICAKAIERGLSEIDLAGPAGHEIQAEHDNGVENGNVPATG